MRRILVDRARHRRSLKAGGPRRSISLEQLEGVDWLGDYPQIDLLALHEALEKLESLDPVKAKVVTLRFFAGLTLPQVAEALGIGRSTADKYWSYAKSWLFLEMSGQSETGSS